MRTLSLPLLTMATISGAAPPPTTRIDNVADTLHGVRLVDPYRWLEDQQAPATRAWIAEQNKYSRSILDAAPGRDRLRKRFTELLRVDALGQPIERGGRYFLMRKSAGAEQPVIVMRRGLQGSDQVLVDPAKLGKGANTSVEIEAVSDDGGLIAYGVQEGGKDENSIHFLEVDSGKHLPDVFPAARYISFAMLGDKSRAFYSVSGGDNPRVREHVMGRPVAEDRDVFGQGYGAEHILACDVSEDDRHLAITVWVGSSGDVTELWVRDLATNSPPRNLFPGVKASFKGTVVDGRAIVLTNWNAPKWRILSVDLSRPGPNNWTEIIPEASASVEDFSLAGRRILVSYLEDVKTRIKIFSASGTHQRDLPLPTLGSVTRIGGRWASPELFYTFTSFHIPHQIYRADLTKQSADIWAKISVPIRQEDFEVRQEWFHSKDGTRVPMFLLHKKGLRKDGNAPVYLGGYGGFNVSLTPEYAAAGVAWAELGGIYAVANLRGGSEFGEEWHRKGMFGNKQNVFDDFIGAAEHLVKSGYTKPSRLAIAGRSNGGLLVGAALTQRPDLFQAVICGYPLLDMVRYHKFLVARFWTTEYGSSDDPAQFPYLRAYSPYHNVKKGVDYPAVMLYSGDGDTRVDPLHARKMAALLQANSKGRRPVILRYDTEAGHSRGMSTTHSIEEYVDWFGFLVSQLGIQLR